MIDILKVLAIFAAIPVLVAAVIVLMSAGFKLAGWLCKRLGLE